MSEITAITPQVKDKTRCNIFVDGRFYCGLTLEAAVRSRLKAGQTIDPARLAEIQLESERGAALDKALHFIAATQKTEKQIQDAISRIELGGHMVQGYELWALSSVLGISAD